MKSMLPMFGNNKTLVSPTTVRFCTTVVTDFILDYHSNFQLFFDSLDFFVTFSIKEKSKWKANKKYLHQSHKKTFILIILLPPTLEKKRLKNLNGGQPVPVILSGLRNEIDVTVFGKNRMFVSPTTARLCTKAVTDFILDYHSNFKLFFDSLDFFVNFFIKEKSK